MLTYLSLTILSCAGIFYILWHDAKIMAKLEIPLNKLNKKLENNQELNDIITNLRIDNTKKK